MKVCIVTSSCLSTNPRVVKEATALHRAGCDVTIVCGDYIPGCADIDGELQNPDWIVRRVPFGRRVASPAVHFRQRASLAIARLATRAGVKSAFVEAVAHAPIGRDLIKATEGVQAELYIAHYVSALPAAARAAHMHRARYTFDAEDFHLGDLPDEPEHALEKQIIRAIERRYLPGAAFVTAASPMIAEAYAETYGIPLPTTVLNVFSKRNAPPAFNSRGKAEPGPSLYWFSQTIGPGRGLETAIEAIALARSQPHLYLRGKPAAGYADKLRRQALKAGVGERLHLLDPAPPDELERLGATYDLGYVGELAETRNRQIAITNKLFSYLLGGVPSLASDIPAHRSIAPEIGPAMSLFPIGDAAALAYAIDAFLLDSARLAAARTHAWRLGQERYNWETEALQLLNELQMALPKKLRPRIDEADCFPLTQ